MATAGSASTSLPPRPHPKFKRIEELLKTAGRNRSDVELAVSPYMKPITLDDLKRYRDLGVDEVAVVVFDIPRDRP